MGTNIRFRFTQNVQFTAVLMVLMHMIIVCNGHGRLIDPPSRSSAFRFGFPTPPNFIDNEVLCGGYDRQHKQNGGRCGECGDAWGIR